MQAKKIKDLSLIIDSIAVAKRIIKPCRIFCIGKNYAEHIRELDDFDAKFQLKNEKHPVVFMKPVTSIVSLGKSIHVPRHGNILHHEVEVVVLLNGGGRNILINDALSYVAGVTLGLDITLRDVQNEVKKKGHPWELSKSFDHSSPLGLMRSYDESFDLFDIPFACFVNEEKRQEGNTKDMIFSIPQIISFLSTVWKLMPGDLIYTGTPSGISVIKSRDEIVLNSPMLGRFAWSIL
jgi:2-keto-4-pentenoate hydratase/2-oxohepta-3-ene-1,7-dioic acid hydratase in catechol pathway